MTDHRPIREWTLGELTEEIRDLQHELFDRRARTPAERDALVDRTRKLLGAIEGRLAPAHTPGAPEHAMARNDLLTIEQAFGSAYEHEARVLRHLVITRAAVRALGDDAGAWLASLHIGDHRLRPAWIATESDEGLREQLRELDRLRGGHVVSSR